MTNFDKFQIILPLVCFYVLVLIYPVFIYSFETRRVRIGVDYGPRFIGIAYSDIFGQVHPLYKVIHNRRNLTEISQQIYKIAKYRSASEIIVGIPLQGRTEGTIQKRVTQFNGQLCLNFSKVLQSVVSYQTNSKLKVKLYDERFTTKEAKLKMANTNSKGSLDSMSAACLLERYLEDCGKGSILAPMCSYPPPIELEIFDYNLVKCHIRKVYYTQIDGDKEIYRSIPKFDDSLLDEKLMEYGETEELNEKVLKRYEDFYIPRGFLEERNNLDGAEDEEEEEEDESEEGQEEVGVQESESNEGDDETDDDEDEEEEFFATVPPPSNRKRPRGALKNPWWLKESPNLNKPQT